MKISQHIFLMCVLICWHRHQVVPIKTFHFVEVEADRFNDLFESNGEVITAITLVEQVVSPSWHECEIPKIGSAVSVDNYIHGTIQVRHKLLIFAKNQRYKSCFFAKSQRYKLRFFAKSQRFVLLFIFQFPQLAQIRFLSWLYFTSSVGRILLPQLAKKRICF